MMKSPTIAADGWGNNCHRLLYSFVFLLVCGGCKKDTQKHNRYSTWTFDGQQFRSNDVQASVDGHYGDGSLVGKDGSHRFQLGFYVDGLPTTGSWPLKYGTRNNSDFAIFYYYIDTNTYVISPHSTNQLIAGEVDGKASYQMSPTWLHHRYDANDSVQIEGTFNEP